MGFSRTDSLLLTRVVTHLDPRGFYRRRFNLFAINRLLRNRQLIRLSSLSEFSLTMLLLDPDHNQHPWSLLPRPFLPSYWQLQRQPH